MPIYGHGLLTQVSPWGRLGWAGLAGLTNAGRDIQNFITLEHDPGATRPHTFPGSGGVHTPHPHRGTQRSPGQVTSDTLKCCWP